MNLAQREAIARYAAEPGLECAAPLELLLDGWEPREPADPVVEDPARRRAYADQLHRENARRITDELAIHERIRSTQLPEVQCPACGLTGWLRRVPGGYRCRACEVLSPPEFIKWPTTEASS
jgi:hypothetical protein